jgi:hypothetical protein
MVLRETQSVKTHGSYFVTICLKRDGERDKVIFFNNLDPLCGAEH